MTEKVLLGRLGVSRLLCKNCCVRSGGRYYSSEGSIIISVECAFQITIICFDPTSTSEDMEVNVLLEEVWGEVLDWVRWKIVVDDVKGGGDYLRGVQLSPLNKLSRELSCGFIGRVVVEISGVEVKKLDCSIGDSSYSSGGGI